MVQTLKLIVNNEGNVEGVHPSKHLPFDVKDDHARLYGPDYELITALNEFGWHIVGMVAISSKKEIWLERKAVHEGDDPFLMPV